MLLRHFKVACLTVTIAGIFNFTSACKRVTDTERDTHEKWKRGDTSPVDKKPVVIIPDQPQSLRDYVFRMMKLDPLNPNQTWRFFMSDDDQDYDNMSGRRVYRMESDISTFDLATLSRGMVKHGITTQRESYNSSDDMLTSSGMRNLSEGNFQKWSIPVNQGFDVMDGDVIRFKIGMVSRGS